jgi:excisionase family DNA binding protein
MPAYLTIDQVAERLHTPTETIRYWIHTRKLRAFKPGRRLLIAESDLAELVESSAIGAAPKRGRP